MELLHYNLEFFNERSFALNSTLCESVKNILDDLDSKIVIPDDENDSRQLFRVNSDRKLRRVNSSGSHRGGSKTYQRNSSSQYQTTDNGNWEGARDFKATKIEKKEGIDKCISDMRGTLNRLSSKNYEGHRDKIIEDLQSFMLTNSDDDIVTLLKSMFTIMSSNIGLSSTYADLFVELVGINESFDTIVDEFVETYRTSVREIHYINPETDYDGFCDYNKLNDTRKCHATFIVNLMKLDMISSETVLAILQEFQESVKQYIDEEGRENDVEEITENIVILYNGSKSLTEDSSIWKEVIQPNIQYFLGLKVKEHISFTSRAKFKYMDCK
tara:strand:+ start:13575 stop:14558 length:984 start_codon:yes stop_codon:yes gene_type:complete